MTLFERLVNSVEAGEARTTRRKFVARIGRFAAAAGAAFVGLARSDVALAGRRVACCDLASDVDCPCRYCCGCSNNQVWTWFCLDTYGFTWQCGECYQGSSCNVGPFCCSWAFRTGFAPTG